MDTNSPPQDQSLPSRQEAEEALATMQSDGRAGYTLLNEDLVQVVLDALSRLPN
jgi:hypothetical protein